MADVQEAEVPITLYHPLGPLTASEFVTTVNIIKKNWPTGTEFHFKVISLHEPNKTDVLRYLAADDLQKRTLRQDRKAFVSYYIKNTDRFHEAIINITTGKIEHNVLLGQFEHGNADSREVLEIEAMILNDPQVKAEIEKLELPAGYSVVSDPWTYGTDGVNDEARLYQCFLYIAKGGNPDFNHYAMPLTISPVVDVGTMSVIRMDYLPAGADESPTPPNKVVLESLAENEYLPEKQTSLRKGLKPIQVTQPRGASFIIRKWSELGDTIEWQNWKIHLSFNHREGIVLYDISYAERPLFYRLSLSDMNVPYGDPRHPYHKKGAFDLGDNGAGMMANNLQLGCDCLGVIHYYSGVLADEDGNPRDAENVVCIHEQDTGIGWKHTNYRTGRAVVSRGRELVIQSVMTVANYEYVVAFIFNLAAEVRYEVRATGILSTSPIQNGLAVPWGTVVHPGVLAAVHQHIFSLRIDPMLDGSITNRLVYDETVPMPRSSLNPHGTGYVVKSTVVKESTGIDLDMSRNRVFRIESGSTINGVNGNPTSYKIQAPDFQKLLSDRESFNFKRAEFADHNLYVTKYRDGELFSGGWYTNQSRGGSGVRGWADRKENIDNEDLVVFLQFGMNHVPRIEDFPVMPCEEISVHLKPVNFFEKNPAIDVPPSAQEENKSSQYRLCTENKGGCKAATSSRL